jgi:hypothetical protein
VNNCKCQCPDFKTHIQGIRFAPSATHTGAHVTETVRREKVMVKDHAAYKALRKDGLQPKSVRGVAAIQAQATDAREITEGKILGSQKLAERNIVKDAMGEAGMIK